MPDVNKSVLLNLLHQCDAALANPRTANDALVKVRERLLDAITIVGIRETGLSWEKIGHQLGRPKTSMVEAASRAVRIADKELKAAEGRTSIAQRNAQLLDYVVRQGKTYAQGREKFGLSDSRIGYIVRAAGIPSGKRSKSPGRRRITDIPLAAGKAMPVSSGAEMRAGGAD